ncbi:unnamed protein product [Allacma fusca]|uniref:GOLD domain-containing protein n=1 Tax=Allacma fusca TaxID=39272 RepID=A0A8J2PHL9_9HEXA|nr:unnamed protein product [Allacma fusca]
MNWYVVYKSWTKSSSTATHGFIFFDVSHLLVDCYFPIISSRSLIYFPFSTFSSVVAPRERAEIWKMEGWRLSVLTFLGWLLINLGDSTDLTTQILPAASQGELDINFQLTDPYNRPLVTEFRKSDSSHSIPVTVEGLYKACFDNTFSHFSVKTVAFGITVETEDEAHWREYQDVDLQPEGVYEVTIEEIQEKTNIVRVILTKIKKLQEEFREVESRDRSTGEHNYERVNFWSLVNLVILVLVGFVQVFMVKGLFDEKNRSATQSIWALTLVLYWPRKTWTPLNSFTKIKILEAGPGGPGGIRKNNSGDVDLFRFGGNSRRFTNSVIGSLTDSI